MEVTHTHVLTQPELHFKIFNTNQAPGFRVGRYSKGWIFADEGKALYLADPRDLIQACEGHMQTVPEVLITRIACSLCERLSMAIHANLKSSQFKPEIQTTQSRSYFFGFANHSLNPLEADSLVFYVNIIRLDNDIEITYNYCVNKRNSDWVETQICFGFITTSNVTNLIPTSPGPCLPPKETHKPDETSLIRLSKDSIYPGILLPERKWCLIENLQISQTDRQASGFGKKPSGFNTAHPKRTLQMGAAGLFYQTAEVVMRYIGKCPREIISVERADISYANFSVRGVNMLTLKVLYLAPEEKEHRLFGIVKAIGANSNQEVCNGFINFRVGD